MYREQLFEHVKKKYKATPEYLWKRFPDYAILRATTLAGAIGCPFF